jgi:hypothetical protein
LPAPITDHLHHEALRQPIESAQQPRFANARSIRNAIDRARLRQAGRLFELDRDPSRDELITIEADDILKSSVFGDHAGQADASASELTRR